MSVHAPAILAGAGTLTLIDGLTFAISDAGGDIGSGLDGLIADDTRHLSHLALRVEGAPVHTLGTALLAPGAARFRGYVAPGRGYPDAPLEVDRQRHVTAGRLTDDITLSWWAASPCVVTVRVEVAADFLDIFQIRGLETGPGDPPGAGGPSDHPRWGALHRRRDRGSPPSCTSVPRHTPGRTVPPDGRRNLRRGHGWSLRVVVEAESPAETRRPAGEGGAPRRQPIPRTDLGVRTEPPDLARACRRSAADLEALALPDGLDRRRRLVAAGIPWFVALFGRDSLIAGHQARAFLPDSSCDTLDALAARQGRVDDPATTSSPARSSTRCA